jgi:glutamine amidotransferase PdxT
LESKEISNQRDIQQKNLKHLNLGIERSSVASSKDSSRMEIIKIQKFLQNEKRSNIFIKIQLIQYLALLVLLFSIFYSY